MDADGEHVIYSFPPAMRFEGQGFFALTAGARGPFDIDYKRDRARVIAPLHTAFSATSGQMSALFYTAGNANVDWAIVQVNECGKYRISAAGMVALEVLPGPAKLVARDNFALAKPAKEITARNAPYRVRFYDGYSEIVDLRTSEVLLQVEGSDPVFSPSGRFVSFYTQFMDAFDVYDIDTKIRLGRFSSQYLLWSHNDSFLYLDQQRDGVLQVVRTLNGRRDEPETPARVLYNPEQRAIAHPTLSRATVDPAGLDLDPGAGGGPFLDSGTFAMGSDAYALDLSVESGAVFLQNDNATKLSKTVAAMPDRLTIRPPRMLVMDLGLQHPIVEVSSPEDLEKLATTSFGVEIDWTGRWHTGDNLAFAGGSWEGDELDPNDVVLPDLASTRNYVPLDGPDWTDDETQTETKKTTIGPAQAKAKAFSVRAAISIAGLGANIGVDWRPALNLAAAQVVGNLRSGRDDDALQAVAEDLAPLFPSGTFGPWPESEPVPYGTGAFFDPLQPAPAATTLPIDVTLPGRDLWHWKNGSKKFWLTQTVEAGHYGYEFGMTLISSADGVTLFADLLNNTRANSANEQNSDYIGQSDIRDDLGSSLNDPSIVRVVDDHLLLIATKPVGRLIAFDLNEWRTVCFVDRPRSAMQTIDLAIRRDEHHIVQLNRGGIVEVYRCADGSNPLSGVVADGDLVVTDGRGFFDGSPDAAAYVELKLPGIPGRQLLSQFASKVQVNGLAEMVLQNKRKSVVPIVLYPPSLNVTELNGKITAKCVSGGSSELRRLDIFSEGRTVNSFSLEGSEQSVIIPNTDVRGLVTLVAIDNDGVASAPVELITKSKSGANAPGALRGIFVGVDQYPGIPGNDLNFAVADAERIAGSVQRSSLYKKPKISLLRNQDATNENVLKQLGAVASETTSKDTLLVSFAGHGLMDQTGRLRLALSGTQRSDLAGTALDFRLVTNELRKAKGRVIVLLDVCHGGASGASAISVSDDAIRQMTTDAGAGIVIFSASKGRQQSEEDRGIGGGRFSVAFSQAVGAQRKSADIDANGHISVNELYAWIKRSVAADTMGRQTPWLTRNDVYGDFDIF